MQEPRPGGRWEDALRVTREGSGVSKTGSSSPQETPPGGAWGGVGSWNQAASLTGPDQGPEHQRYQGEPRIRE